MYHGVLNKMPCVMLKWPASTLQVQLPKDKLGFVQFSAGALRRRQVVKQSVPTITALPFWKVRLRWKMWPHPWVTFPLWASHSGGKPRRSKARIVPVAFLKNIKHTLVRCGWAVKAKVNNLHCQAGLFQAVGKMSFKRSNHKDMGNTCKPLLYGTVYSGTQWECKAHL